MTITVILELRVGFSLTFGLVSSISKFGSSSSSSSFATSAPATPFHRYLPFESDGDNPKSRDLDWINKALDLVFYDHLSCFGSVHSPSSSSVSSLLPSARQQVRILLVESLSLTLDHYSCILRRLAKIFSCGSGSDALATVQLAWIDTLSLAAFSHFNTVPLGTNVSNETQLCLDIDSLDIHCGAFINGVLLNSPGRGTVSIAGVGCVAMCACLKYLILDYFSSEDYPEFHCALKELSDDFWTELFMSRCFVSPSIDLSGSESTFTFFSVPFQPYRLRIPELILALPAELLFGVVGRGSDETQSTLMDDGKSKRIICSFVRFIQSSCHIAFEQSIVDTVVKVVLNSPVDIRICLIRNITLSGPGSIIPGLRSRLLYHLNHSSTHSNEANFKNKISCFSKCQFSITPLLFQGGHYQSHLSSWNGGHSISLVCAFSHNSSTLQSNSNPSLLNHRMYSSLRKGPHINPLHTASLSDLLKTSCAV